MCKMSIYCIFGKSSIFSIASNNSYQFINLFIILKKSVNDFHQSSRDKSTNVDVIDSFTNELIERKTLKWELLRQTRQKSVATDKRELLLKSTIFRPTELLKEITNFRENPLNIELKTLNQHQIDNLYLNAMYSENKKDLHMLVEQCVLLQKGPTNKVFVELAEYFANIGNRIFLEKIINLCSIINTELYKDYIHFIHLIAKCTWVTGNSTLSLNMMQELYAEIEENEMKSIFKKMMEDMVKETVGKKSEAVLVSLKNVAVYFHKEYKDNFLLAYLWNTCFQSIWYSDQQLAAELFSNYEELRKLLSNRIARICFDLLKEHNVEGVHRLIELLLRFEMINECKIVLSLLFDYQYWRRNLRACTEILQNCLELDIELSEIQHNKLLSLLLNSGSPTTKSTRSNLTAPVFELKF